MPIRAIRGKETKARSAPTSPIMFFSFQVCVHLRASAVNSSLGAVVFLLHQLGQGVHDGSTEVLHTAEGVVGDGIAFQIFYKP